MLRSFECTCSFFPFSELFVQRMINYFKNRHQINMCYDEIGHK